MNNVIAEIGLNHGGDINSAKKLIQQAKDSGCWGVKFQYRDIDSFYQKKDEVGDTMIFDEIKRNFITMDDLVVLANLCHDLSIEFGISVFRLDDFWHLEEILTHIDFFKIPSAECLNTRLLSELLKTKKKVFVSTGGHETDEVIEILSNYKNKIILLHCISNYPSYLGTQDLCVITKYKSCGFLEVGYSSHDEDWEVCLLALSQGANWIERHITLEKNGNGLDHSSSSVVDEFIKLVRFANEHKKVLGVENHKPNQGELINLQNLGTSLYANRNIKSGEVASFENFDIKAPRVGISPARFIETYNFQPITSDLKRGMPLSENHFSSNEKPVSSKIKSFAKRILVGIPVRLHDYLFFKNKFDLSTYEFHLSFTEVLNFDLLKVINDIDEGENISIHLPDYIPGNKLLDPISRDKTVRDISREVIDKVSSFAIAIEQKTLKKVNIIGSFSQCHNQSRILNLEEIVEYIRATNKNILPQWLPVFAWYFGGTVKLQIFNSYEDVKYLTSNKVKICLDLSHLVMATSHYGERWEEWFQDLMPCIEHMHISDAASSTSEGLMFGDGLIGNFSEILSIKKMKIIECWQGHLNEGEGFKQSLDILYGQFNSRGHHNG